MRELRNAHPALCRRDVSSTRNRSTNLAGVAGRLIEHRLGAPPM